MSSPCVVSIHGGGFRGGNKSVSGSLLTQCLESGISVAAITYRLSGEAKAPARQELLAQRSNAVGHELFRIGLSDGRRRPEVLGLGSSGHDSTPFGGKDGYGNVSWFAESEPVWVSVSYNHKRCEINPVGVVPGGQRAYCASCRSRDGEVGGLP